MKKECPDCQIEWNMGYQRGKSDEQKRVLDIVDRLNKKYPSQMECIGAKWFEEFYAKIKEDVK